MYNIDQLSFMYIQLKKTCTSLIISHMWRLETLIDIMGATLIRLEYSCLEMHPQLSSY